VASEGFQSTECGLAYHSSQLNKTNIKKEKKALFQEEMLDLVAYCMKNFFYQSQSNIIES
jgi:hypothetical protein